MATTLRELIAKVVFKADPSELQDFDANLDEVKAKLGGLQEQAKQGLNVPAESGGARLVDFGDDLDGVAEAAEEAADAVDDVGESAAKAKKPAGELGGVMGQATKYLQGLATAAAAYKALQFGVGLVEEARAVGDLAASLGIATDDLQTWSAFAEEVGASSEDLAGTVKNLAKNMSDVAQTGKGPAADAFKKLGISTAGWAEGLPPTLDMLLEAGGALADVENDAQRLALAQQLLGESSLKLLPAFEGGTEAAREQLAELRELAVVYDEEFIANSTAATNEMKLLERQLKGVGVSILIDIVPAFRDFVRWITPGVKAVRDLIKNSSLLQTALVAAGAIGVVSLVNNVGTLVKLLQAGGRIMLRFVLPLLILDDIITFLRGGKSVLGGILDQMFGIGASKEVLEGLQQTWQALIGLAKLFWGLLTGDSAAVEEGEMLILKFGGVVDSVFNAIGAKVSEWAGLFVEAAEIALASAKAALLGWADDIATYFAGIWTAIVDGLVQMLATAGSKLKGFAASLPLIGRLFKDDNAATAGATITRNAEGALAAGAAASVDSSSRSSTVTVNDNSSVNTTLNGVDATNIGPALRASENNVKAMLQRSKAQTLKQTVGAAAV